MSQTVNVYWVRHGYSCANKSKDNWNPFFKLISDPVLHERGIEQAVELGKKMRETRKYINIDLFCSSQLRRAIETSKVLYEQYDKNSQDLKDVKDASPYPKILILPHINEEDTWPDNMPNSLYNFQNQSESKRDTQPFSNYTEEPFKTPLRYSLDYKSDYKSFENTILSLLVEKALGHQRISVKSVNGQALYPSFNLNIVIVSHSNFIKKVFGFKMDNCEVVHQMLVLDTNGFDTIHDAVKHAIKMPPKLFNTWSIRPDYKQFRSTRCDDTDKLKLATIETLRNALSHYRSGFKKSGKKLGKKSKRHSKSKSKTIKKPKNKTNKTSKSKTNKKSKTKI